MIEKKFANQKLTSYIDDKQNVWFRGKDIAKILGYRDTDDAVRGGSQWGGGYYGYRLKFWLFYGYRLIFFSYG